MVTLVVLRVPISFQNRVECSVKIFGSLAVTTLACCGVPSSQDWVLSASLVQRVLGYRLARPTMLTVWTAYDRMLCHQCCRGLWRFNPNRSAAQQWMVEMSNVSTQAKWSNKCGDWWLTLLHPCQATLGDELHQQWRLASMDVHTCL